MQAIETVKPKLAEGFQTTQLLKGILFVSFLTMLGQAVRPVWKLMLVFREVSILGKAVKIMLSQ